MKKAELEKEILELKARIIALETRPQFNYCGCNHVCTLPHYISYPTQPFYPVPSVGTFETARFGNIS
jgi:hypothetical protein